jgi:hypothetical protein
MRLAAVLCGSVWPGRSRLVSLRVNCPEWFSASIDWSCCVCVVLCGLGPVWFWEGAGWSRCAFLCGFGKVSAGRAALMWVCIVLGWSRLVSERLCNSLWIWAGLGWSRCACDSVWFPAGLCWSRYVWMCGFGLVSAGLAAFVWSVWFFLPCSWVSLSFPFIIGPMSNSELDIPLVSSKLLIDFLKFPLICFTFSVQCPTHELDIPYVS